MNEMFALFSKKLVVLKIAYLNHRRVRKGKKIENNMTIPGYFEC